MSRWRPMIGMVLVAHGQLADRVPRRAGTCRRPAEADRHHLDRRRGRYGAAPPGYLDGGASGRYAATGVVVLTDMFGGTPSNLAISVMNGGQVEVVAGINLPMLIKLASIRDTTSLEQAVIQAQDAGRKYIYVASRVLGGK